MGCYDYMMKYLKTRQQFGNSLYSYQLIQDKIVKVMINVQASLLLVAQAQKLMEQGKATIGHLAFVKAASTKMIR